MLAIHRLANGKPVRQDYSAGIRFVMFHTDIPSWPYATHGGTAFIVTSKGRFFGLLCRHALADFHWSQLALTDEKVGKRTAGVRAFVRPTSPVGAAIDGDMLDLGVVEFSEDVDQAFFKDSAYVLGQVATGRYGGRFHQSGPTIHLIAQSC